MRFTSFCAMCCVATLAATASAQTMQYTNYLGAIKVPTGITPIIGDSAGRLFYGTFLGPKSELRVIENPESFINTPNEAGTTISVFTQFDSGRGLQSLQAASNGSIFASGDTGKATLANVWKFNPSGSPVTWTEDATFTANATATPARRSGVAIISETGAGLISNNGFTSVDYFDFSGNKVGATLTGGANYMREAIYNGTDNILYTLRNGVGTQKMLIYYVAGINPVSGGGNFVTKDLILDGASNGNNGSAKQNGFFISSTKQLITLDGDSVQKTLPKVRIWDLPDSGTSVSLAYSLSGISETQLFQSIEDAAVINDKLYVDSSTSGSIFVFGPAPASVNKWDAYGDR